MVLYALGYEYDFVQGVFLKTGSFDVKTNVSAQVYVNDNFAGKTSFLGDYFSQSRLLPRAYNVRVQAQDYQVWQKLVTVDAGFLTSFPKVILLPKVFQENVIASSSIPFKSITIERFDGDQKVALIGNKQKVDSIDLATGTEKPAKLPLPSVITPNNYLIGTASPDGDKVVRFDNNEIWINWIKDSPYQPFKKAGDLELVTRFPQTISDIQWYKDSDHLIVSVGGLLKFIEIDDRDGINIFDISSVSGPFYYDNDKNIIYKFDNNKLVKINLK